MTINFQKTVVKLEIKEVKLVAKNQNPRKTRMLSDPKKEEVAK